MTNNNISSQGRLQVDYIFANLRQWFVLRVFVLKQFLKGSKQHIAAYCVIDGKRAIVYSRGLASTNPSYLEYLTHFADEFEIHLQEVRRVQNIPVSYERRYYSLFAILLSLLLINSAAFAENYRVNNDENIELNVQEQNITQLLNWIRFKMSRLEFEVGRELPNIQRLPRSKMYKLAFGDNIPRVSSKPSASIYGLYNYEDKTIYMLDSIDINTTKGKAILLHELVHYLQYQNGHDHHVECKNRLEYLAYYLEAAYLKEHGEKVGFSKNHLRRVVQCQS
jgi:hypothetical protein